MVSYIKLKGPTSLQLYTHVVYPCSFAVTAKLICAFVFAYAKYWFSHDAAQLSDMFGVEPRFEIEFQIYEKLNLESFINARVNSVTPWSTKRVTYNRSNNEANQNCRCRVVLLVMVRRRCLCGNIEQGRA